MKKIFSREAMRGEVCVYGVCMCVCVLCVYVCVPTKTQKAVGTSQNLDFLKTCTIILLSHTL